MVGIQHSLSILLGLFFHASMIKANVWTVDCGVLTTQRMDPIVFPGKHPAGHVHAIVGASRFGVSVDYEDLQMSQCTSCNVAVDLSNYWVPQLYIKKQKDGKFYYVDMDFHVYYKLINDKGQTGFYNNPLQPGEILPFPNGFQVLAGSPLQTEADININHKCMGPGTNSIEFTPNPENCWAIRAEITFPSCWDGINDGTEGDHSSHMTYAVGGYWNNPGPCPPSHPVRLPTLFYEAIYLTGDIFEAGDELVYSFNDTIGYGFHGDFLMGWNDGNIQSKIDYCIANEDGATTQCGNEKAGPYQCPWDPKNPEIHEDPDQYRGVLDELPPWN